MEQHIQTLKYIHCRKYIEKYTNKTMYNLPFYLSNHVNTITSTGEDEELICLVSVARVPFGSFPFPVLPNGAS